MKINPAAIQSYQQVQQTRRPARAVVESEQPPKTDSSITIAPQRTGASSRLAVTAPANTTSESLTPVERKALELLFQHLKDPSRSGIEYHSKTEIAKEQPVVGGIIDIKV